MIASPFNTSSIYQAFRRDLSSLYPAGEINQILNILFERWMGWSPVKIRISLDEVLPSKVVAQFEEALALMTDGMPLQYIIGVAWFGEMELEVTPDVLIPRPETAEMCVLIRKDVIECNKPGLSILDVGTGSGCVAIDLKLGLPAARVMALEVSTAALEVAKSNARKYHAEIEFFIADILKPDFLEIIPAASVIVSNPPYVTCSEIPQMRKNVTTFEPGLALYVPDNDPLLYYRAILNYAGKGLIEGGSLYFEINENFGNEVVKLLEEYGFRDIWLRKDMHGKERFVKGIKNHAGPEGG